jgi:hypothetical protein
MILIKIFLGSKDVKNVSYSNAANVFLIKAKI